MIRNIYAAVFIVLVSGVISAATNTTAANPNVQPKPAAAKKKPTAAAAQPDKISPESALLKKRIAALNKNISALNREMGSVLKRLKNLEKQMKTIATKAYVNWMSRRVSQALINKAFAGTKGNSTRVPVAQSAGGVKLVNINVGRDTIAGETVGPKGVLIQIVAGGPKWSRSAKLYIYAVPVKDMIMRPRYLIHADGEVPLIKGQMQTHLKWQAKHIKGTRMTAGNYKILVRVVFYGYKKKWLRVGHALRYWGDNKPASYNLRLR